MRHWWAVRGRCAAECVMTGRRPGRTAKGREVPCPRPPQEPLARTAPHARTERQPHCFGEFVGRQAYDRVYSEKRKSDFIAAAPGGPRHADLQRGSRPWVARPTGRTTHENMANVVSLDQTVVRRGHAGALVCTELTALYNCGSSAGLAAALRWDQARLRTCRLVIYHAGCLAR